MAGRKSKSTRERPEARWRNRAAAAATPAARLAVAYDRLRAAAAHANRSRRDPVVQAEAATLAAAITDEAAHTLTGYAQQLEAAP